MPEDVLQAAVAAPEQVETAQPVVTEPEVLEPSAENSEPKPEKTFTQAELDEIISKRLEKERRKLERELRQQAPAPVSNPQPEQYATDEAYQDALVSARAEKLAMEREQQRQIQTIVQTFEEREDEWRDEHPEYDVKVKQNGNLPITYPMRDAIYLADNGPAIAMHLADNLAEAKRISNLPPMAQALAIGEISRDLKSKPVAPRTTSAPPPIKPVTPSGGNPVYDTTDPRAAEHMDTATWIQRERERQKAALEARYNR